MFFGRLKEAHARVTVNRNWCKGCGYCVTYCPTNVLTMSKGYNAKGYHPPEVTAPEQCRDCRFCEMICPEFAIFVTEDKR